MNKKQVFISYTSLDLEVASKICEILEKEGLSCWIANRDILPGMRYPREIIKAIDQCIAFVLVFSEKSNNSIPIFSEVERAFSKEKPVFPFRIKDVQPSEDLEFFIKVFQWCDALENPLDNKIIKMADAIKQKIENEGPSLTSIKSGQITETYLINNSFYPIAVALNDIKEQELTENYEGIENATIRLIELFTKLTSVILLSAIKDENISEKKSLINHLIKIRENNILAWVGIIEHIIKEKSNYINNRNIEPLLSYLENSVDRKSDIGKAMIFLKGIDKNLLQNLKVSDFIIEINQYANQFLKQNARIKNASKFIKYGIIELLSKCEFFMGLKMAVITDYKPAKELNAFEHELLALKGLTPEKSRGKIILGEWEYIERSHIICYSEGKEEQFIDLYPFILFDEQSMDIKVWEKSPAFEKIFYKKIFDKSIVEQQLIKSDPIITALRASIDFEIPKDIQDFGRLVQLLDNVKKFMQKNVSNPFCIEEFTTRLDNIKNQMEFDVKKDRDIDYRDYIERINQIKYKSIKGIFPKLIPTEIDYILTDENKGKYIIADRFYKSAPEMVSKFKDVSRIIKKDVSQEVCIVFYIALSESVHSQKTIILGVEHLMIAISKICNELILNWYDAIGISPKYHRDMIRYALKNYEPNLNPEKKDIIIKDRVEKVFQMAIEEVNLSKRDEITLLDLFSAILREGQSLPIRLLHNIFDMTNDRLLSDFYHLLRQK